jgi:hypothetical protein
MPRSNGRVFRMILPLFLLFLMQGCNIWSDETGLPASSPEAATQTQAAKINPQAASSATKTPVQITLTPTVTYTPTITRTLVPVTYPVGPTNFPVDINPLTGLRVHDPEILNRRPLAVKVPNYPRTARPQAGLSQADILIEFYTEAGSTRFIAMYYGQEATKIGPIRSARIMDTRIIPHFDAILVHVQAFETVWDVMSQTGISNINEYPASCPVICRDETITEVENRAWTNTIELTKYARRLGMLSGKPNLDGMLFDSKVPEGGKAANGLWIQFSSAAWAEWKYDTQSKRYLRFSEKDNTGAMEPLNDRITGQQVAIDNLVVMIAPIRPYYSGKPMTGELWDVDFTGSGRAVFFRDGQAIEGQWQNTGPAAPFKFVDNKGNLVALHPGSTYIAVLGYYTQGGTTASTEWKFYDYR